MLSVVYWGTYDKGKPRNRILLAGLRSANVEVIECHSALWDGIKDKSQISGWLSKAILLFRWLWCYPFLIAEYWRLPAHDCLVVGYMGHLDLFFIWPFAKLKGVPICWDAFLSLYNTVVEDRQIAGRYNPLAWFLFILEWLACRLADTIILDTKAHGCYFVETFKLPREKVKCVLVGAETDVFTPAGNAASRNKQQSDTCRVLFYGQFSPLHGVKTVIQAAKLLEDEDVEWILIGHGQEAEAIKQELAGWQKSRITWLEWVHYEELRDWLTTADVCIGVLGDTAKARLIIPNKVFQAIAAGCPIITMESPAIRELVGEGHPGIVLVPPAAPEDLARAVQRSCKTASMVNRQSLYRDLRPRITPEALGREFFEILQSSCGVKA